MAELNINNLELDDNTFEVLPEGDYHFTVASHEVGYYSGNSKKIPENTQQVTCELEIPTTDRTVTLRRNAVSGADLCGMRRYGSGKGQDEC